MNSISNLETLDLAIPPTPRGKYKHHPISQGQKPDFYKPEDLKDTGQAQTGWLHFFETILVGLYWRLGRLGRPVPYAFRTWDGTIRSLDAGCLKFLENRSPKEVIFHVDTLGYIDSVEPSAELLKRYEEYPMLKPKLIKNLDVPIAPEKT